MTLRHSNINDLRYWTIWMSNLSRSRSDTMIYALSILLLLPSSASWISCISILTSIWTCVWVHIRKIDSSACLIQTSHHTSDLSTLLVSEPSHHLRTSLWCISYSNRSKSMEHVPVLPRVSRTILRNRSPPSPTLLSWTCCRSRSSTSPSSSPGLGPTTPNNLFTDTCIW